MDAKHDLEAARKKITGTIIRDTLAVLLSLAAIDVAHTREPQAAMAAAALLAICVLMGPQLMRVGFFFIIAAALVISGVVGPAAVMRVAICAIAVGICIVANVLEG